MELTAVHLLPCLSLPAAYLLDALLGDPRLLPHPVRWMGWAIMKAEPWFRRRLADEVRAGGLFAVSLIVCTWLLAFWLNDAALRVHVVAGFLLQTLFLFYCFSARSLSQAGMAIYHLLQEDEVDRARAEVAMIVGRDVQHYQGPDIARATVETVAENAVDGMISPLFYAALGGAPLALAYKMVNTLDSMVGYKNTRYLLFGRIAARIDDVANYFPARLSPLLIAVASGILGGPVQRVLMVAKTEGFQHASPNAGYPEAAFAGALGVRLNGPNYYGGILVEKPYIGKHFPEVTPAHIRQACLLMQVTSLLAMVLAWLVSSGMFLLLFSLV